MHTYGQGRYRVVGPLGSGAFAVVHEVEDTRLGVRRALKVLRPEVAGDPVARARFAAEARTMASLRHPHLVGVLDVGEDVGDEGEETGDTSRGVGVVSRTTAIWLVMELLPGGTLAEAVQREGASDPVAAVRAMLGVIEGVGLAHRSGVVHRDIKPANLLVDADGGLKLGDFGVAQLRTMDDLTRTGVALGSWAFMAPEQRLDPRRVGPTSDVYGLAATLVWRIHGAPVSDLHVGEHRARLLARAPEGLAAVLSRALAFRAEERYRTAEAFSEALREAIAEAEGEGTDVQAHAASSLEVGELGAGAVGPVPRRPHAAGSPRAGASSRDGAAPRDDTVAGAARVPARGGALRAWGLAGLALVVGVGAGGWAMTREEVRGRFVDEPEEVRRARELAAIPVCEDAPTGWSGRSVPRWSTSVAGGREAGGGVLVDIDKDGHTDVLLVHALEEEFRVYWGTGSDLDDVPTRVPAARMAQGIPRAGDAGDLDGDGDLDLVGVALEGMGFVVSYNLGGRRFSEATVVSTGSVPHQVRVLDWDDDELADLMFITASTAVRTLMWRKSLKNGGFGPVIRLSESVASFDAVRARAGRGTELYLLDQGTLSIAQRDQNNALTNVEIFAHDLSVEADIVRAMGDDALVWDTRQHRTDAVRYARDVGAAPCRFTLPGAPGLNDIGNFDTDLLVDALVLRGCAYCTSNLEVFLGTR